MVYLADLSADRVALLLIAAALLGVLLSVLVCNALGRRRRAEHETALAGRFAWCSCG